MLGGVEESLRTHLTRRVSQGEVGVKHGIEIYELTEREWKAETQLWGKQTMLVL